MSNQFVNVLAVKPIEKANTVESFIEVDNALNKLKSTIKYKKYLTMMMNTWFDKGISSKLAKNYLKHQKTSCTKSEIDVLDEKVQKDAFALLEK